MNNKDNLIEELTSQLQNITEDYDVEEFVGDELINEIADRLGAECEFDDITGDYIINYNDLEIHYLEDYEPDVIGVTITKDDVDMTDNLPEGTELGEDVYIVNIPSYWTIEQILDAIQEIETKISSEKTESVNTKKVEGVSWDYYDRPEMQEIEDKYLPPQGEGDNFAQQIVTAITKLIYKYYNDGDRYDGFNGYGNDMTSYANWLYKYVSGADTILDNTDTDTDSYEYVLRQLNDKFLNKEFLAKAETENKKGTIYECDGPYEFEDDDYEEDEEEW